MYVCIRDWILYVNITCAEAALLVIYISVFANRELQGTDIVKMKWFFLEFNWVVKPDMHFPRALLSWTYFHAHSEIFTKKINVNV